jgi:hypothetical protein
MDKALASFANRRHAHKLWLATLERIGPTNGAAQR